MANANKTTITAEPGKQEMLITREFDAPRELVFQAFTDPELYVQWLGPRRLAMMLDIARHYAALSQARVSRNTHLRSIARRKNQAYCAIGFPVGHRPRWRAPEWDGRRSQ